MTWMQIPVQAACALTPMRLREIRHDMVPSEK